MVTGKGYASVETTDSDKPLIFETLYSAKASGSVFSPQKYAMDNKDTIDKWSQTGSTKTGRGAVAFYDHNDQLLHTIPLYPKNGLFYMKMSKPE